MRALLSLLLGAFFATQADAASLTVIDAKGVAKTFTTEALLGRPDAETIEIAKDVSYGGKATYRGVRLNRLLADASAEGTDVVEATATDGFVAQLPLAKVMNDQSSGAVAYLAVEDPGNPWPRLKKTGVSAGPFYIVWRNPERSSIPQEAWPYQTAQLEMKISVEKRYPAIVVSSTLPANHAARRGQALFIENCFTCHRMNGAGEATIGPDLNRPMNPTEYIQPQILPRLIRSTKSVRQWGDQKMPDFESLSAQDINAIVAYLTHMATRK